MITVPIEVSARHVHLTAAHWRRLFGGDRPTVAKTISQAPQFVAVERVTLSGPAGEIQNVGVVGPLRPYAQVELAKTDALRLGIDPPLTDSGHLEGAVDITITGLRGSVTVPAAILQQRHIHVSPAEAAEHGLTDRQIVSVAVDGHRGGVMNNVLVRVHPDYRFAMHVDTDEANAFGLEPGAVGVLHIP